MKNLAFFIAFVSFSFSIQGQDLYRLHLNEYQEVVNRGDSMTSQLKLPVSTTAVIMGGLNDLDGMNNYFNLFGSKLIVDSSDMTSDGIQNLVLRREDGRDFFDMFPTLSAKLIPITHTEDSSMKTLF